MAQQHGYIAERGPYAKGGDASEAVQAWYYGELATIKLNSGDRWQVIHELERHAQTLEDTHLAELLQIVASQLRDATKREQRMQAD